MSLIRPNHMVGGMRLSFVLCVQTVILFCGDWVQAQDAPSPQLLDALIPQLQKKLPAMEISFQAGAAANGTCAMQQVDMTMLRGSEQRTFSVLIDPQQGPPISPKQVLARINRLTVDADGGAKAYHPDDPYGQGTCDRASGPNGQAELSGVCALDEISNGGIRLFVGSTRITRADPNSQTSGNQVDLALEWRNVWPLIRDRKLKSFSLRDLAGPQAPADYYLFYWKERDLTVFFDRNNIPSTRDGYPCVRGQESRYPGYFVSATTLTQQGAARADGCAPERYIDAEQVPYFVLPGRAFGHVNVGDVIVGYIKLGALERLVFGIAADTGPFDQFGEGSIAFNQQLLGRSELPSNIKSLYALDINLEELAAKKDSEASLAVLVLGGTKHLFKGNYSPANVENIGRQEFARWSGGDATSTARLNACVALAKTNNSP
jgi:hypothetical protein